jgi:hypothetical protein
MVATVSRSESHESLTENDVTKINALRATAVVMRGPRDEVPGGDPRIHVAYSAPLAYGEAWMVGTSPARTVHPSALSLKD